MTYLWLVEPNGTIKNKEHKTRLIKYYVITKEFYAWVVEEFMLPMSNCDTKKLQDISKFIKTAKNYNMMN